MKIKLLSLLTLFAFFYSYAQGEGASYNITFESNWSQATHPHPSGSLPGGAHWSPLVGAIHNDQISFFEMGALASQGIENIAETGSFTVFNNEVNNAIAAETAQEFLNFGDLDSDLGQITGSIEVDLNFHYLSLISMIAPSPDWIVAASNISLLDDTGNWIENDIVIDLYAYDAGTDNGEDYTSGNSDTNPAQPISSMQGVAPFSSEIIGTLTISLEAILSTNQVSARTIGLFPNPTNGIVTVTIPQSKGTVRLYDITGKLLGTKEITSSPQQLDYTRLSSGVYMMVVESDKNQTVQRLIKS